MINMDKRIQELTLLLSEKDKDAGSKGINS
jgi:hypothetical protein